MDKNEPPRMMLEHNKRTVPRARKHVQPVFRRLGDSAVACASGLFVVGLAVPDLFFFGFTGPGPALSFF